MNNLYEKLEQIRKRPCMYIGEKKITYLAYYMMGYRDREFELTNPNYDTFMTLLQEFIHKKYNEIASIHWYQIILRFEKDEAKAFDKFYELLDEFMAKEKLN